MRTNKYWNNLPETLFIALKKLKWRVEGRSHSVKKETRDQRETGQIWKRQLLCFEEYSLGTELTGERMRQRSCSWKLSLILYSTQGRFSDFQVFLPPSLQGTIDTRETFILAQIRRKFWSSPQCPIVPQLRDWKKKRNKTKPTPPCTLAAQEYGFIKYLATSSQ